MQMREPAGVLLLIDQDVVRLRRTKAMAPDLHRAVVFVELDIEKALAVLAPHEAAVGVFDKIVEILGRFPIADADRKIFRTGGVRAPGLKPVVP